MFPCQKNIYLYKKSRYRLLYLYKIYYIYYNVITLSCDEFGTITYNSQLLFYSLFEKKKNMTSISSVHYAGLRLVINYYNGLFCLKTHTSF